MAADDSKLTPTVGHWLAERGLAPKEARSALQTGKVWLQALPVCDPGRPVEPGLSLRMERPRADPRHDPLVVHRDARWVVVYKPSGLLSVPAPGRREPSVLRACERWFGRAFAVHRIDEGTSGLLLVALDEPTQLRLKERFEVHDIERRYLALVRGVFPPGPRTFRSALVRDRGDGRRGSAPDGTPGARPAITHVERVALFGGGSLVEARLETGRTHQVRIHLSEAGHPLFGDELYGGGRGGRLALHAHVLGLRDPWSGAPHRFVAPLPDDLARRVRGAPGA